MKLQYLDSPNEKATISILAELGVTTSSNNKSNKKNATSLNNDLCAEHTSTFPVAYEVVSGTLDIDVRDEADCWIRASLQAGDLMKIPATVYRRIAGNEVSIVESREDSNGNRNNLYRFSKASDRIAVNSYHNYRELVCELCRQFFTAGWVTGTGGSISIRYGNRIYMTPSGVQKERIEPDELYVLDTEGAILCVPEQKPGHRLPKLSDCSPLFLHAFKQRKAGAVLHSHSLCCNMATSLFEGKSEFRISHQEMIKGIKGYGYFDELAIPIIENTAHEHELADSLGECIANNPKACAVLVRRHGMYVWGDTWEEAKRHGECLHYLFEVAINMKRLSMDFNSPPHPLIENGKEMQIEKQNCNFISIATKNTLSPTTKLQYLDSPNEKATISILAELGITTSSNNKSNKKNATSLNNDLCAEHTSTFPVTYEVVSGTLDIDVRDEADCWIRASLQAGDLMKIPATVYRRIAGNEVSIVESREDSNGNRNNLYRFSKASDRIAVNSYHNYRELVCELCRQFFTAGWVTGTGGSISIRYGNRIYMTPSGVQKERIEPDELYVLDTEGAILCVPEQKPGHRLPKLSDCSPLFLHAFKQRKAGAVLHSHSLCCNMATSLFEGKSEFRISHQEMIKGIKGYGYFDELAIPIIENTAHEHELADSLGECIANNPKACAVLVRRHGMYVWGDTWEEAKRHGECLHYLFEVAINMKRLSMDFNSPPHPLIENGKEMQSRKRNGSSDSSIAAKKHQALGDFQYVLFDIEGTTTPITFVKDILFPYAAENFVTFLEKTWTDKQTIADVQEIKKQASIDLAESLRGVPPIAGDADKDLLITSIVEYLKWNMSLDRKIAALKDIQGHVWAEGYATGKLTSIVYDDVARFFVQSEQKGFKIGIYSSGSRDAQRLLFKYSNHGDLRKFLSCYFDTSVGQKRTSNSYTDILKTLGVDHSSRVVFVTDILEEAVAASEAGMQTIIAVRPGNVPLPENHGFRVVTNFDDIL